MCLSVWHHCSQSDANKECDAQHTSAGACKDESNRSLHFEIVKKVEEVGISLTGMDQMDAIVVFGVSHSRRFGETGC